jgi:hypothetical protein
MTPQQKKLLTLCDPEQQRLLRKRWRQAAWARRWRAANPELHLERVRETRKRLVTLGYYRKGGKGYSPHIGTPKRLAYFRWYNANVRASMKEGR